MKFLAYIVFVLMTQGIGYAYWRTKGREEREKHKKDKSISTIAAFGIIACILWPAFMFLCFYKQQALKPKIFAGGSWLILGITPYLMLGNGIGASCGYLFLLTVFWFILCWYVIKISYIGNLKI